MKRLKVVIYPLIAAFLILILIMSLSSAADLMTCAFLIAGAVIITAIILLGWKRYRKPAQFQEAQDTVAASEQRYRTIFENTGAATIIVEADTTISLANTELEQLTGYTKEEIEGKKSWTEFIAPEDLERMRKYHDDRRLDQSLSPKKYEFLLKNRNGELRNIMLYVDTIPGTTQSAASLVDITELKHAQATLREREEMFRALTEKTEDVIMRFDREHRHLYVNPAVEKATGIPPAQFIGKTHAELGFPDELVGEWDKALEKVFRERTSQRMEFKLPGGAWIDWLLVPEIDSQGEVQAVMTSARDISSRRQAEEELRQSEERFRDLFENSLDLICTHDLEGRFLSVNPAGAAIFEYDREAMVGKAIRNFITPEYRHEFDDVYMAEMMKKGRVKGLMSIQTGTGKRRILEYNNTMRMEANKTPIIRGIVRDITGRWLAQKALEKSERKYRIIFERAVEGIFQYNREGRFISVNSAMARMCGYDTPEEMMKSINDLANQFFTRSDLPDRFRTILASKDRMENFEHKIYRRDGSEIWVSMSVWAVKDDQGRVIHYEGTQMDISERIEAEKERRRLEHQLAQSQKMEAIGTLAGGVAHDFNNLLMGIQGYASLMLMDIDPSHPHYERLKGIEKQVASGADLTKQILGFARGGRYEKKPASINDMIERTALIFSRTKKEIIVRQEQAPDLWTVEVDMGQMERVLMNLYVNAWQAMPGGGELFIRTENIVLADSEANQWDVKAGRYVKIALTDTGVGMDEKTLARIFDPFFTTKAMGRGTGLGLATVYGIVKGHEGAIQVESECGLGTTFHVYLPASEKAVVEKAVVEKEIMKGTGMEKILIVDDEETILEVSRDILEALGYGVYTAGSGEEAAEILAAKGGKIDLVILDMVMPGLSGGETFDRLRKIDPRIRVLLSSGYSIEGQAQEILNRGCNGFIQKPFNFNKLSSKVREILDERD